MCVSVSIFILRKKKIQISDDSVQVILFTPRDGTV